MSESVPMEDYLRLMRTSDANEREATALRAENTALKARVVELEALHDDALRQVVLHVRAATKAEARATRLSEALKRASQVGEIRFRTCVLSAQVADEIAAALSEETP